jgi:hypothetical protein
MCCGLTEDENELVHMQSNYQEYQMWNFFFFRYMTKSVTKTLRRCWNVLTGAGKYTSEFMWVILFVDGAGMFL